MTGSFWRRLKSTAPCNNSIVGGRRHLDWQGPEWSKADLFLSGSRLLCAWTSSMILKLTGIYSFNRGKFEAENKENEIPLHMASEKLRFVFHLFLPSANTGGHSRMTRRIPNILGLPLGRWGEFRQRSFIFNFDFDFDINFLVAIMMILATNIFRQWPVFHQKHCLSPLPRAALVV